jgi:Ca-activated chloride channel family protein
VGIGNCNDVLLKRHRRPGRSLLRVHQRPREARQLFIEGLPARQAVASRQGQVSSTGRVAAYRLLGYENRAIADDEFRDRASMPERRGRSRVTALYVIRLRDRGDGA